MEKAVIFYFSGTGNTYYITDKIREGLEKRGINTRIFSIEKDITDSEIREMCKDTDLIGIGYPTHGSDAPIIVHKFLERLPHMEGKKVLVFITEYMASGDGAYFLKKKLAVKGLRLYWAVHFKMPNNLCLPGLSFAYGLDDEEIRKILDKAEKRVEKLVDRITAGKKWIQGSNPFSRTVGGLQRYLFRKMLNKYTHAWSVDPERCTLCGLCAKLCATGNITLEEKKVKFDDKCTLCMRCFNFCPSIAVMFGGKKHKENKPLPYRGPYRGFNPMILKK